MLVHRKKLLEEKEVMPIEAYHVFFEEFDPGSG